MNLNTRELWRGESPLDGAEIVALMSGVKLKSLNPKTEDMYQVSIERTDISPLEAVRTGRDESVCGGCLLRPYLFKQTDHPPGAKPCYVNVGHSINGKWSSWAKGRVAAGLPASITKPIRFGDHGDPAMLPENLVLRLIERAPGWTGYTHQWREPWAQWCKTVFMASAGSATEATEAQALGWRTFRTRQWTEAILGGEIMCPASKEGGMKSTCAKCRLCSGSSLPVKNITIIEH